VLQETSLAAAVKQFQAAIVSRLKILAKLDIAEKRVPQDGRIKIIISGREIDVRVSVIPMIYGEAVVLRLLDRSSVLLGMDKLGMSPRDLNIMEVVLERPHGIILVTGPTGSGKTTSLYAALSHINDTERKIITIEDPIEYQLYGINQIQVSRKAGLTFASGLRAILRHDPDVVLIGEIRDSETAEIAIQASLTGHLVFSTLHTNDAPSSVTRMVDIGVPSYILAGSLTMVLAQRLGRRLCKKCKTIVQHEPEELLAAGFKEEDLEGLVTYGAVGCADCNGLGYRGRVGFFELLEVTDEVGKAIAAEVPEDQLYKVAIKSGMVPLRRAALKKVQQGVTSLEEALRRTVVREDTLPAYLVNPDIEEYEDGDVIIQEGNQDKDFYKLVRGRIAVLKSGKKIAEITEPGEYFGEMAAISDEPRFATIVSVGRSAVTRYPGDKLMELIEKYPEIARKFFKTLVERLQKTDRMVVKLASAGRPQTPPQRPMPAATRPS